MGVAKYILLEYREELEQKIELYKRIISGEEDIGRWSFWDGGVNSSSEERKRYYSDCKEMYAKKN